MPKRSRKKPEPEDTNQIAARIVATVTGAAEMTKEAVSRVAAELGRRGGLKGGKARAAKLSKARRSAIAKKAASARWKRPRRGQAKNRGLTVL
jgi:hypothetical protein